jgi:hypothetical protein
MSAKRILLPTLMIAIFCAGYLLGNLGEGDFISRADASPIATGQAEQVFELRTYTAAEGKIDDLLARFRDHTLGIFETHNMTSVGYWTPQDAPLSENTLIYILAHLSREAAAQAWQDFINDPEWKRVAEESQRDGPLIVGLESVFLDPTDFSPMK